MKARPDAYVGYSGKFTDRGVDYIIMVDAQEKVDAISQMKLLGHPACCDEHIHKAAIIKKTRLPFWFRLASWSTKSCKETSKEIDQ